MKNTARQAPILVFPFGNPSRGDDALGPAIYQLLNDKQQDTGLHNIDLLTDFQLQIEHALDLEARKAVIFVDASVTCTPPYEFYRLQPEADNSYTTHAMSPASVLEVYRQVNRRQPPPAWMLSIRGYDFELGQALSGRAGQNLLQGYDFLNRLLITDRHRWPQFENGN